MPYNLTLRSSANWLKDNQDKNGGWGLAKDSHPSIVNTAEAIYVLSIADSRKYYKSIKAGIDYIERNALKSVETIAPRTRYVIFGLLALLEHIELTSSKFVDECTKWLIHAQNKDGGWGQLANDENSSLFPTCMAILVLTKVEQRKNVESSYNWIKANINDSGKGWSFFKNDAESVTATAMAIVALRTTLDINDQFLLKPKEFLLTTDHVNLFDIEAEEVSGTAWSHCSYMWVFPALISLGVEPFSAPIAETVRSINKLIVTEGWKEPHQHITIRGQYWAVTAFESLRMGYDPSVHTYWFDSFETGKIKFKEPEYVIFNPHEKWALAVPRRLYLNVTYGLFMISIISFSGIYRKIGLLPRTADFIIAIIFFGTAYSLIKRRKKLFSKKLILYIIFGLFTILELIDLIFGKSVHDLFIMLSEFLNLQ